MEISARREAVNAEADLPEASRMNLISPLGPRTFRDGRRLEAHRSREKSRPGSLAVSGIRM